MSTPTVGGDLEVDYDLESMMREVLACRFDDCDAEATHRVILRPVSCSHISTVAYCRPHAERAFMLVKSWPMWQCKICGATDIAGEVEMISL